MNADLNEILDTALAQRRAGEPLPSILARYPQQAEMLQPLLETAVVLHALQPVEMPAAESLQADRDQFLAQVARMQPASPSAHPLQQLKRWLVQRVPRPFPIFVSSQKEQRPMSTLLVKSALILTMLFGSVGGTAVVASDSLPNDLLYPVKLVMEQTRLKVTADAAAQANLHLELAQERVQEMVQLALAGNVPDEATMTRLQQHLNQALHLAAQLPEPEMVALLNQTQALVQTQEQRLAQAQERVGTSAQERLKQANQLLKQTGQEARAGVEEPQTFRWQHGYGEPPATPPRQTGPCDGDCDPAGDEHRHGPQPDQPGPGEPGGNPDCDGDCEPAGDEHHYGPQPDQPGPGESGGNPDCDGDCEPAGDEHHYGPQPDQLGPGEPGGNPDCDGDCEPVGDEHHHGPQPNEPGSNSDADNGQNGDGQNGDGQNGDGQNGGDQNGDSGQNGDGQNGDGQNGGGQNGGGGGNG